MEDFKEIYRNRFLDRFENNFETYQAYFEYEKKINEKSLKNLSTLNSVIIQNLENLILENYISSIVITSHLLEKFCKLVIVVDNMLGSFLTDEDYNEKINNAYHFDDKVLENTIAKMKSLKLITDGETKVLDKLRKEMRNPFGHSETLKITKKYPSQIEAYHANILDPTKLTKVNLNTKSTFLKSEQIELEAKRKASSYFKQLMSIIVNVDNNLSKKAAYKINK